MASRIRTYKKSTREKTPDSSTAPAQPMFQSRPFVVQPQKAETSQEEPDLKTALILAKRYGYNLNKIQLTNSSIPSTGIQPKSGIGKFQPNRWVTTPLLQAKLTHGQPGDQYEREAERATTTVVQTKKGNKDRQLYKQQQGHRRAKLTVGKADQPLEPTNPHKATQGHGHADHGYQTTATQQGDRIRTGITPSGRTGKPVSKASHFTTPEAEAEALGRAKRQLQASGVPQYDAAGEPNRHTVQVTTKRKGGFGQRVVKQKDPTSGKVIKDASGKPLTTTDPTVLTQASVTFEFIPSKNEWHPVTYYPG